MHRLTLFNIFGHGRTDPRTQRYNAFGARDLGFIDIPINRVAAQVVDLPHRPSNHVWPW